MKKRRKLLSDTSKELLCSEGARKEDQTEDPYSLFLFAMRSPKTREKCIGRFRMFFDFINISEGPMENRCLVFYERATEDPRWAYRSIIRYLQTQKERCERKEITAGSLKKRFQAVKLFCEMNGVA
jgi:hypothetical protein